MDLKEKLEMYHSDMKYFIGSPEKEKQLKDAWRKNIEESMPCEAKNYKPQFDFGEHGKKNKKD